MIDGGYDQGYLSCDCFWGEKPGKLVNELMLRIPDFSGMKILDVGCGEGKNAYALSSLGAEVTAIDCSEPALANGQKIWNDNSIHWIEADVRDFCPKPVTYHVIVAYGLYHCFSSEAEITKVIKRLKRATKIGGYNILCTFNEREQDLSAHPGLHPCLLTHEMYREFYSDWDILICSDETLFETHPHNMIPHQHSLTRILAKRIT